MRSLMKQLEVDLEIFLIIIVLVKVKIKNRPCVIIYITNYCKDEKTTTNTNLLILDELFDSSLDMQNTDDFFKILKTLQNENTFIISHK